MAKCRQCGRDAGLMAELCDICAQVPRERLEQQDAERKQTEFQADLPTSPEAALTKRYRDAYLVARGINGFGGLVKGLGMALAILIALGTVIAASQLSSDSATALFLVGFVCAAVLGLWFYLIGVIVSALGQIHKANLNQKSQGWYTAQ